MKLKLITAPSTEPVTLAAVKLDRRIETGDTDQDTRLTDLITTAREAIEMATGRALITQKWQRLLDAFPGSNGAIELARPPVSAIEFVKYVDNNGTLQTLDSSQYELDAQSETAYVVPAYGVTWPTTRNKVNAVQVQFVAGYGDATAVPSRAKQAMLLLIGHYFENREPRNIGGIVTELPLGVSSLISGLVVSRFV